MLKERLSMFPKDHVVWYETETPPRQSVSPIPNPQVFLFDFGA